MFCWHRVESTSPSIDSSTRLNQKTLSRNKTASASYKSPWPRTTATTTAASGFAMTNSSLVTLLKNKRTRRSGSTTTASLPAGSRRRIDEDEDAPGVTDDEVVNAEDEERAPATKAKDKHPMKEPH